MKFRNVNLDIATIERLRVMADGMPLASFLRVISIQPGYLVAVTDKSPLVVQSQEDKLQELLDRVRNIDHWTDSKDQYDSVTRVSLELLVRELVKSPENLALVQSITKEMTEQSLAPSLFDTSPPELKDEDVEYLTTMDIKHNFGKKVNRKGKGQS